jgi:uncharacterized protein YhdP
VILAIIVTEFPGAAERVRAMGAYVFVSVAGGSFGLLVGGQLEQGRALISGDLDHWPFRDRNGRFEATAHLRQATLKFNPEWPAVEGVEADAVFLADGLTVDGTGRIGGVAIQQLHGAIDITGTGRWW